MPLRNGKWEREQKYQNTKQPLKLTLIFFMLQQDKIQELKQLFANYAVLVDLSLIFYAFLPRLAQYGHISGVLLLSLLFISIIQGIRLGVAVMASNHAHSPYRRDFISSLGDWNRQRNKPYLVCNKIAVIKI